MFTEFEELFSRHGRLEGHEINAQFNKNCVPKQQKERRIPLQLQNSVEKELEKLIEIGHIKKVNEIKDDVFTRPTVITVKREKKHQNSTRRERNEQKHEERQVSDAKSR